MNFEEWIKKYQTNRVINVKREFNDIEIDLLNKLNIYIKDELYTGNEFECLMSTIGSYNKEEDMSELELKYCKSLEDTDVSEEEYEKLSKKIDSIFRKNEKVFVYNEE